MIKIFQSGIKENNLWDEFVYNHKLGWLTSLSSWEQVIKSVSPSAKAIKLVLIDDNCKIKAAWPMYLLSSPFHNYRISSIPLATISDPLVSSFEELKLLISGLKILPEFKKAGRVQIKALKSIEWLENIPLIKTKVWKYHCLGLNDNPENIWKRLDRTCIRKNIRKAIRNNLRFRLLEKDQDLMTFFNLYSKTRKRLGLPTLPFSFFKSIYELYHPTGKAHFFFARYRSLDIAALMVLSFKDKFSAEALGWDPAFKEFSPVVFVYWEAIEFARSVGAECFDFGRTHPKNVGLLRFKRQWGGEEKEIAEFVYPSDESRGRLSSHIKSLQQIGNYCIKISPFFFYHLLSRFYYYHYLE